MQQHRSVRRYLLPATIAYWLTFLDNDQSPCTLKIPHSEHLGDWSLSRSDWLLSRKDSKKKTQKTKPDKNGEENKTKHYDTPPHANNPYPSK